MKKSLEEIQRAVEDLFPNGIWEKNNPSLVGQGPKSFDWQLFTADGSQAISSNFPELYLCYIDAYAKNMAISAESTDRIYVIVAESVQPSYRPGVSPKWDEQTILQVAGRIAAQVGHVVSKMRLKLLKDSLVGLTDHGVQKQIERADFMPYTTIILGARDSAEMYHIVNLLEKEGVPHSTFFDFNEKVYSTPEAVLTAIATVPVHPTRLTGITDYLPLWTQTF